MALSPAQFHDATTPDGKSGVKLRNLANVCVTSPYQS